MVALAALSGACSPPTAQDKRELMVNSCITNGHNPVDCADAARETIP
jgi:hypothetical protein